MYIFVKKCCSGTVECLNIGGGVTGITDGPVTGVDRKTVVFFALVIRMRVVFE